jgi:hypothetical protein
MYGVEISRRLSCFLSTHLLKANFFCLADHAERVRDRSSGTARKLPVREKKSDSY